MSVIRMRQDANSTLFLDLVNHFKSVSGTNLVSEKQADHITILSFIFRSNNNLHTGTNTLKSCFLRTSNCVVVSDSQNTNSVPCRPLYNLGRGSHAIK